MSTLTKPVQKQLENRVDEIRPLLELSGQWTIHDVDEDVRDVISNLSIQGGIRQVDKILAPSGGKTTNLIRVWEWNESVKQELIEYLEQRTEFRCGHKVHLWNPKRLDGYYCQDCMENGVRTEISRETLEETL